jgi:Protein of unknown function (DUF1588)/Protein of unknown function (DUF1592)/Protein of unknown function (DUF1585)/Planctomycete cytochrome C
MRFRLPRSVRFIVLLSCAWTPAHADEAVDANRVHTTAVAFLRKHCLKCHGAEMPEGSLRLDDMTGNFTTEGSRWNLVLDKVRSGEMPPEDTKQPTEAERTLVTQWVVGELGRHAQRQPNLGNLVPHDLLFGAETTTTETAVSTAPRLWRISGDHYLGWVEDVARGRPKAVVRPFSGSPERGIQDFASLARVDEPTTELLFRNAILIVDDQTRHEIVDGKVEAKHDTVREFTELMDPSGTPTREQLETAIQKQFSLAIARRAESEEVERLLVFYENCSQGGDRPGAVKALLTTVLMRTDAIFRSELGDSDSLLTPRETAMAISAALMHRRETRIIEAAENGQLATREQIAEHVRRILDDPKIAKPRLLGFFREYFEYDNATEVFKDEPKDLWHRPEQHVRDTDRLILHLLAEDKDVFRELLTTPLAFANVKTATNKETRREEIQRALIPNAHNQRGMALPESLYGLDTWTPEQPFAQKPQTRIGILMQPSWLIAWSENFHNDIVRRGRFIRERLLGGTVPDLPIGVAAMVPGDRTHTLRDRVSSVTRDQRCWKCHQQMDDLGLPFEQFDHFGRRLEQDWVLDPAATEKNVDYKGKPLGDILRGLPLDTKGLIANTGDQKLDGPLSDPYELITRLANSDRCRQVWIRHVFRYYLGRNESLADAKTLQDADRTYQDSNGSFKALLVSLLTSDSFLKRAPLGTSQDSPPPTESSP